MAWIYFQESEGSRSLCPTMLEQLPIVNVTDTHNAFYCPECDQVSLTLPPFGTMCKPCEETCYLESTSLAVDFPVRTFPLLDLEQAWTVSEADYFLKLQDSQESVNLNLFYLKTSLPSEPVEGKEWLKNWPRSGMTVDGRLYRPQALEPCIKGSAGSYLPTPIASEGGYNRSLGANAKPRPTLATMARHNMWPTPCARDWKDNGKSPAELERNSTTLATIAGGQLNPQWIEWLMGYRIGYTELSALETEWFRCKSKRLLKNY